MPRKRKPQEISRHLMQTPTDQPVCNPGCNLKTTDFILIKCGTQSIQEVLSHTFNFGPL
jgi:hypothetical protein